VAYCGEKTGKFRIKDVLQIFETNICCFVRTEIMVSYFYVLMTKTDGERVCLKS
jgi:hypothetical protein